MKPQDTLFRGSRLLVLLTVTCLLAGGPAAAQDEEGPLETDRPDITETSTVVGRDRLQIETSIIQEYFNGRRRDERNLFTPTLFRYGLSDRWEARLETAGYSRSRTSIQGAGVSRTAGYSPLAPGVKYHFQDPREGSCRPSLGAIFHLNVPSGSGDFRAEKLTGDIKLAADWDLAPKWSLGANFGFFMDEDDTGESFAGILATAALARDLTDRLRVFAELALSAPEASDGRTGLIFDGGFAYLINPNTQVDLALGTGLSGRTTPDFYWTIGFSRRW